MNLVLIDREKSTELIGKYFIIFGKSLLNRLIEIPFF